MYAQDLPTAQGKRETSASHRHRKRTIVASHKRIAIAASHLAINKFPRALEGNVHVAVD
jgi:hypothetical protein